MCVLPDQQYGFSTWLSTPIILYPHFFIFFGVFAVIFISLVHSILQPDGKTSETLSII